MDLYSFGKICAWILAAHTEPPDEFAARRQPDYYDALEALQGIHGTAHQDTPHENLEQFKEMVRKVFALTLADSSLRASGIQGLLNYLHLAARCLKGYTVAKSCLMLVTSLTPDLVMQDIHLAFHSQTGQSQRE